MIHTIMDRRSFLKTTGVAAIAGAATSILPACGTKKTPIESDAPVRYKTQVLVVGGGPAGVCAALAAARNGVKVLLVEQGGCLGGMATRGLVAPFMTCFDSKGEIQIIRGLFGEIVDRMVALGGAIHPREVRSGTPFSAWITTGHDHCTPFDAETMKFVLDSMCAEAGVKVLFHASFVRAIVRHNTVTGIILLTKSGLETAEASIVVDATGDGEVCASAGNPCEFGNEEIGKVQPATLFFHINNVDSSKLIKDVEAHLHEFRKVNGVSYRALHWRVAEAEASGEWDIARKSVNIYRGVREDEWAVNCTRISGVDATDSESLTAAEIEGRRQIQELLHFFHKYVPGCEKAVIKSSASTIGIRESRHVAGKYLLTADDLLGGLVPEDSVLLASNSVDVHGRLGANTTEYKTIDPHLWYGVPYRSLVPEEVDGLLVAGRAISATSDAAGAVRVIPPCMAMGQAAGTAAAIAVRAGKLSGLDFDDIRRRLISQNVFLG